MRLAPARLQQPLLFLALVPAAVWALLRAEEVRPASQGLKELSYFPSGRTVQLFTAGHDISWADVAWFQTVQYYGKHRKTDQDLHMLGHLASIIADLDPHFLGVFRFVGFCLGQEGHDFPGGMRVLNRAIAENPDNWQPWFDAGFMYYVVKRDYRHANYYLSHAAKLPRHPPYVERMAGWVAGKGGYDLEARQFWADVLLTSDDPYLTQMARTYLERLKEKGKL